MNDVTSIAVRCTNCGQQLPSEWASEIIKPPCPKCGSLKKEISIAIVEDAAIKIHESLRGKLKDANFSSKKNPRVDFFVGDDLRKSDGKWMQKERLIDKNNRQYREVVIDPQTGEIVHHVEEPLSDHFGHGSDKFNKSGG